MRRISVYEVRSTLRGRERQTWIKITRDEFKVLELIDKIRLKRVNEKVRFTDLSPVN